MRRQLDLFRTRRSIPSAPGYDATSDGHIVGRSGCVLKTYPRGDGRDRVRVSVDGRIKIRPVQALVGEAYPEGNLLCSGHSRPGPFEVAQ